MLRLSFTELGDEIRSGSVSNLLSIESLSVTSTVLCFLTFLSVAKPESYLSGYLPFEDGLRNDFIELPIPLKNSLNLLSFGFFGARS